MRYALDKYTRKYYIYEHTTLDGTPFYIGRGQGDRSQTSNNMRSKAWHNMANNGYKINILFDGLTFNESVDLEIKTIKEYKNKYTTMVNGSSNIPNRSMEKFKVIIKETNEQFNSGLELINTINKRLDENNIKGPRLRFCGVQKCLAGRRNKTLGMTIRIME
jgi:hypothetical protein